MIVEGYEGYRFPPAFTMNEEKKTYEGIQSEDPAHSRHRDRMRYAVARTSLAQRLALMTAGPSSQFGKYQILEKLAQGRFSSI